jgi:cytochrome c
LASDWVLLAMNSKLLLSSAVLALAGAAGTNAQAAGDIERGKTLYQTRCAACHSIDYNGVGPAHKGVFGSTAGKVAGYNYSDALKTSNVVWNEKTLNQWLADPQKFIPGQKMGLSVPAAKERDDILAFLKKAAAP